MLSTVLDWPDSRPLEILCLGAHCDDIEIGCGGTLFELTRQAAQTSVHWVTFASDQTRKTESSRAADGILEGSYTLTFHDFRDGYFPDQYGKLKDALERLKLEIRPDLIFTHYQHDYHQDHRVLAEITTSTFRSHLILEYEIPKYDGDLGNPPVLVPLLETSCRTKSRVIVDAHKSQADRQWFSEDTFMSLMRLRGMQCNSPSGYAEAFYCRKLGLSLKNV